LTFRFGTALEVSHAFHMARALAQVRTLDQLRATRSSIKWRRYAEDVLPAFVAEMDFDIDPAIVERITEVVRNSDTGYLDDPGPLAPAFARYADDNWGWRVEESSIHLATDVTVGMVETLRLVVPPVGGRVIVTPPVYPPFFEMVAEVHADVVEVPLREDAGWSLDLAGVEAAFDAGADALLLCNPHNPTGRCHGRSQLRELARLAARHGVLVVSDEVHAPLTHPHASFTPFAPVAAEAGARSVTVTSASKGWNLAALKCAIVVAGDGRTADMLTRFPDELAARTSNLGLHANVAAFDCGEWLSAAIARIGSNLLLLKQELRQRVPLVTAVEPDASYLVWLDFRNAGLGDDPAAPLVEYGRVALNSGLTYGSQGAGFARINIACDPSTIVEAVRRIARTVEDLAPSNSALGRQRRLAEREHEPVGPVEERGGLDRVDDRLIVEAGRPQSVDVR
jgi:cystathionine beta-lyase